PSETAKLVEKSISDAASFLDGQKWAVAVLRTGASSSEHKLFDELAGFGEAKIVLLLLEHEGQLAACGSAACAIQYSGSAHGFFRYRI
ncbi:MAG TPA: hypothetical protein P5185_07755, partial [Oscillospiraceae bacterium]|nr:hypothetical protein [Oscillospiraceae bacterium]